METSAQFISVVLCTRNRAEYLEHALRSLVEQDYPRSGFEIVLVDNGSTDRTQEVAQSFSGAAELQYVREDLIGLCIARNTGWRAARGPTVAYFDDDAVARPGWLRAIGEAFARHAAADVRVIGGPVIPIWQADRPPWLDDKVAGSLTIVDWGESEKVLADVDKEWLVGANMAMPKTMLEEIGGFHPGLDRIGNNLLSSGDVFLQKQVTKRGFACLYIPEMAIEHIVPPSRLQRDWFLRRFYWQGISDAVMYLIERSPTPGARIRAAWDRSRRLARNRRRLTALVSSASSSEAFALRCFAWLDIGFILGLLGAARR